METKQQTPSVIAKLMGFDELPPQQPIHKHQRVLSDDYLRKTAAIALRGKRSFYEDRSSKKKVQKQQEFNYGNTSASKSSNISIYRNNEKGKISEKKSAQGNLLRSLQKLDGGSIIDTNYLQNLSKSPLKLKAEVRHSPSRIVVLKLSLGKAKSGARSSFSPSSSLCSRLGYRNQGFHRRMNGELCNEGRNKENPVRDKGIIRQIKHIIDRRSIEVSTPEGRNFFQGKNKDDSSPLSVPYFAREGKKRDSEQWKINENSQEVGVDSKGFTPYQESRAGNLNYTVDKNPQCSQFSKNSVGGTPKSRSRKEAFYNGKFLMLEKAVTDRNRNIMRKERLKLRDSRFSYEKSPSLSYVHIVNNNQSVEETPVNLEELEKKLEDLSKENSVVSKCEDLDYNYSSQRIQDEPKTEDVRFGKVGHSCSEVWESSTGQMQQSSIDSLEDGLNLSSCTKVDSEFSMSSGEAYQPSPDSVLETPFMEEILSDDSKCFESVDADLYGVWMQLHLLKSEVEDTNAEEPSMLVSSDEDSAKGSVDYSEENCKFTKNFRPKESRDFSYLVDVLDVADFCRWNLEDSFVRLYSPEIPLDPSLFDALEKKYGEQTCWKKSERRLLFDRINSGLMEILRPYTDSNTRSKPLRTRVSATLKRNVIEEDLWFLLISQENEVKEELSEKAVGSEIRWLELGDDIEIIGREIEILLFDELVAELV